MIEKQNFKHLWSILCTQSSVDTQSNNLSLFNVIEQINLSKEFPLVQKENNGKGAFVPMRLELVTLWERITDEEDAWSEVVVDFQDPKGQSLQKFPYSISTPKKRLRHFMRLNGFPVTTESGRYIFKIKKKDGKDGRFIDVGEIPLEVNIAYTFPAKAKKP